jgi:hypothetical protein
MNNRIIIYSQLLTSCSDRILEATLDWLMCDVKYKEEALFVVLKYQRIRQYLMERVSDDVTSSVTYWQTH